MKYLNFQFTKSLFYLSFLLTLQVCTEVKESSTIDIKKATLNNKIELNISNDNLVKKNPCKKHGTSTLYTIDNYIVIGLVEGFFY